MMTIKDFGARVVSVWEGLRPMTKKMLVGALQANPASSNTKYSYDAHADWELSRLLSALDEQANESEVKKDSQRLKEIGQLAKTCIDVLESKTESAEIFIQLAERALAKNDYKQIDKLGDLLARRFSIAEMAEIARQSENPAIRALAYEAMAMVPPGILIPLLDDPLYEDIVRNVFEQQAYEFENDEARRILEQIELDDELEG
jgi:hypothetical protein